jgi:hypothetical protein
MSVEASLSRSAFATEFLSTERRALIRYPWSPEISCHLLSPNRRVSWWARVHDISGSGIGLTLNTEFRVGAKLTIELHSLSRGYASALQAKVVHCAEQAEGTWKVGCSFERELREDELRDLL